ncbi:hypothetical protein J8273_4853 [Carpediemonas membranifera]|uniref:Uncharacterized protein n=1 Tax=Carpediemonas membranifera TaxID=201153 RepID=A0A8J6B5X1_9EUKA|nr:hypothetical protein J8273_4853 [Carpediemonas membranifera]|eukprot:KAG9393734.1 hypothetical protein J8273_4853 [Carpediemonas membranifera]
MGAGSSAPKNDELPKHNNIPEMALDSARSAHPSARGTPNVPHQSSARSTPRAPGASATSTPIHTSRTSYDANTAASARRAPQREQQQHNPNTASKASIDQLDRFLDEDIEGLLEEDEAYELPTSKLMSASKLYQASPGFDPEKYRMANLAGMAVEKTASPGIRLVDTRADKSLYDSVLDDEDEAMLDGLLDV